MEQPGTPLVRSIDELWDSDSEAAWSQHQQDVAQRLLVTEALVVGVALTIALVIQLVVVERATVLRHPILGLPGQATVCFVGAAALAWVPALKRHPYLFGLLGYAWIAATAGVVLGDLGGMDGPFFYITYMLPCVVIGLPAKLALRCVFTMVILGAFMATFFGRHPEHLDHGFADVAWLHLTGITCAFIYFGHVFHRTARERFILESSLRKRGVWLERDNEVLTQDVQTRTRDWLAASDRAASVRWEERSNLARALHDDLGQLLVCARADLEHLEESMSGAPNIQSVSRLRMAIDGIERSARGIVYRDDILPFEVEVEDLVETYRALGRAEIDLTLRCQEWEPDLELRDVCKRVVQESLNNVFKHAEATRVEVTIAREQSWVRLLVSDDGHGRPEGQGTRGRGLRGMQERVEAVGGSMLIDSEPSQGFAIRVALPLPRATGEDEGREAHQ